MKLRRHTLAPFLLLLAACSTNQEARVRGMASAELAAHFSRCVTPFGVSRVVAAQRVDALPEFRAEVIFLGRPDPVMSDAFHHLLLVDREGGRVYIAETGGFAGVKRWYGPLDPAADCRGSAPTR